MKRFQSIAALFLGTFLLIVSQHEVHARNYLLWALGLDQGEGSGHSMMRGLLNRRDNHKTRERIQETRYERRQERKEVAAAAEAAAKEAETLRVGATGQNQRKKNKKNRKKQDQMGRESFLRVKVAKKIEAEQPEVVKVGLDDIGGGITRDMNIGQEGKARKNGMNAGARAKADGAGGGGGKAGKFDDGKARKNKDNFAGKQKKNQKKNDVLATKRTIDPPGPGGTSLIDIGGGGKARKNDGGGGQRKAKNHGGGQRKAKNDADQRKVKNDGGGLKKAKNNGGGGQRKAKNDGDQRKVKNDGGQHKAKNNGVGKARVNAKQKNLARNQEPNARQRQNQKHYLKKLAHHRVNQQVNVLEFLDRTFDRSFGITKSLNVGGGGNKIARDGGDKTAAARSGKNTKQVARDGPGGKPGGGKAKPDEVAKGRQEDGKARKKDNDQGRGRGGHEKNMGRADDKPAAGRGRGGAGSTAQQRQKEARYEKMATNREQNQRARKKNKDEPKDRTFGGPAKGKQVAPIALARADGKANPHKHKLGYNKRKQEKIQREKALHNKKNKIDAVTLNDSGHLGRIGGLR